MTALNETRREQVARYWRIRQLLVRGRFEQERLLFRAVFCMDEAEEEWRVG